METLHRALAMIDLMLMAKDTANTPERRALLMAALDDDARALRRTMEDYPDHGAMLADDFFVPFVGICAATGSRELWQALGEWGYTFKSPLRLNPADRQDRMDIGGWAAQILEPRRLLELMGEGLLDAFASGRHALQHTPAELGMLGDDDLFVFWLEQWRDHWQARLEELTPEQRSNRNPVAPRVMETLCGMASIHAQGTIEYPNGWPGIEQVHDRLERLMEAFVELHYGHGDTQLQWQAFQARPAVTQKSALFVKLCQHMTRKAPHPFQDAAFDRFLTPARDRDLRMVWGLLESGAPLVVRTRHGLGAALLKIAAEGFDDDANGAWDAWVARARVDMPWALTVLPGHLLKRGNDHSRRLHQDQADAKRLAQALAMAEAAGPALSSASRPRL